MNPISLMLTVLVTVWAAAGTYFIKIGYFWTAAFFYWSTTFAWWYIIRDSRLVAVGTVYGVVSVIVDILTGILMFGEVPTTKEIIGGILGLIGIIVATF